MNKIVEKSLIFVAGAAIGSLSTYLITKNIFKKKYQAYADEQIESVKEAFKGQKKKEADKINAQEVENIKETFRDTQVFVPVESKEPPRPFNLPPTAIDTKDGYPDYEDKTVEAYLIRPEDFGNGPFHDICEWVLWNDGIVTDDTLVHNDIDRETVSNTLPYGWINQFGWDTKYHTVDNVLYYRSNKDEMDIEIRKEDQTYYDWMQKNMPDYMFEDEDE